MSAKLKDSKGSNFVYVIVLMFLLGVLAAGYGAFAIFDARMASAQRSYQKDYYEAISLRKSVVTSICAGDNQAAKSLESKAQADYQDYFDALEAWSIMTDAEKAGAAYPELSDYVMETYSTSGTTLLDNGQVLTTLKYYPETVKLELSMKITLHGETRSLGAQLSGTGGEVVIVDPQPSKAVYALGMGSGAQSFAIQTNAGALISGNINSPSNGAIYKGDLISSGKITMTSGPQYIYGSLYAEKGIVLTSGGHTVKGSLYTRGNAELVSGTHTITGSVYAMGNIHQESSTISGSMTAGGTATIRGTLSQSVSAGGSILVDWGGSVGGSVSTLKDVTVNTTVGGDVTAGTSVTLRGTVGGNITAAGDVMVQGSVGDSIVSGEDVTVDWGGIVHGNITALGNVTVRGTVEGNVTAAGRVILTGNGVKGTVTQNAAGLSAPEITDVRKWPDFSPIDQEIPDVAFNYAEVARNGGELGSRTELDAQSGDVYYTISSASGVDLSRVSVIGSNRVFLVVGDNVKLGIYGTIGESATASKLFLITKYQDVKNVKIDMYNGTVFYGQIYMPQASLTLYNPYNEWNANWTVHGMVTVEKINGKAGQNFIIDYVAGAYQGTALEPWFGGSGGGTSSSGGSSVGAISAWKAEGYYDG